MGSEVTYPLRCPQAPQGMWGARAQGHPCPLPCPGPAPARLGSCLCAPMESLKDPPRVSSLNFVVALAALLSSLGCSSARLKLVGSFSPSGWDFPV